MSPKKVKRAPMGEGVWPGGLSHETAVSLALNAVSSAAALAHAANAGDRGSKGVTEHPGRFLETLRMDASKRYEQMLTEAEHGDFTFSFTGFDILLGIVVYDHTLFGGDQGPERYMPAATSRANGSVGIRSGFPMTLKSIDWKEPTLTEVSDMMQWMDQKIFEDFGQPEYESMARQFRIKKR